VHRLWAGTKLVGLLAVAVVLSVHPTWPSIGVMAAVVVTGLAAARVPPGAAPRLPRWIWVGLLSGAVLALLAGGRPDVAVGSIRVGVGALGQWTRALGLALVIVTGAALVSWTTPVAAVAPALRRLGAPLRLLRVPVDAWAAGIALSFRCLPLLLDEVRVLAAVRRLREGHRPQAGDTRRPRDWRRALIEPQDLLTTAMVVGLRRAAELARAMEARGGPGPGSETAGGPGALDVAALVVIAAAAAAALVI
jgi:energy-coupling factor transporter transmembrane protein EcfT